MEKSLTGRIFMPDLFGESVVRFPEERRCGRRENFSPSGSAVCVQFWKKRNGYCLSRVRLIKLLSCPEDLFSWAEEC